MSARWSRVPLANMLKPLAIALGLCFSLPAFAESSEKPAAPATESTASAAMKVGTGVEKRQVTGEATTFAKGTTVWAWSEISNGEGTVKHVWKLDGKPVWTATLPVKSKKWSTQSRRTITKPGNWEVSVTSADGTELSSIGFSVTAS